MKILFLNTSSPNYLIDGLLHGLKSLSGLLVVDVPRMDIMYQDALPRAIHMAGNRGKTLYKLLRDQDQVIERRTYWLHEVADYDYILFTDILDQCDLFHWLYYRLPKEKRRRLVIVDGYDTPSMFPYIGNGANLKVRPWVYLYKTKRVLYFKREYENPAQLMGLNKVRYPVLNSLFNTVLKRPQLMHPITMSVPEELIEEVPLTDKPNLFVNYNIDPDLKELFASQQTVALGQWKPTFITQEDYFNEIKQSKFGITTKRAGWDCLRHYEYAAKGAILCFKNLHLKSNLCAPLGLTDKSCIIYSSKENLLKQINQRSNGEIQDIQHNQYQWIAQYTTKNVAQRFLNQIISH